MWRLQDAGPASLSPGLLHRLVRRQRFVNKLCKIRFVKKATEMPQRHVQSIGKGLVNFTLRVKSGLSLISVNKVLLKYNHSHLLTYCLCSKGRDEQSQRRLHGPQSLKALLPGLLGTPGGWAGSG